VRGKINFIDKGESVGEIKLKLYDKGVSARRKIKLVDKRESVDERKDKSP
jgi:hypothetical protein